MLSGQHLRVKVPVQRRGYCFIVCLSANAKDIREERNGYCFSLESAIHGYEMEDRCILWPLLPRSAILLGLSRPIVLRGNHGRG